MATLGRISNMFDALKINMMNRNYSARIQNLKKDIFVLTTELMVQGKENHDAFIRCLAMEGYLALLRVKNLPYSLIEKRNILQSSFIKLRKYALRKECFFILLRVQNRLCYYLIQLDQIYWALDLLESIEDIYNQINEAKMNTFLDAEDLFSSEPINNIKCVSPDKIDNLITDNLQMQAFLYSKINLHHKYTLYYHTVLQRQLEITQSTPQDWALRTARLGNYFTHVNQIRNARHHLCAANYVLRSCHTNCIMMPEKFILQMAGFEIHFLELSHYFVKYGLRLFKLSKKKILNEYFTQSSIGADLWRELISFEDKLDKYSERREENEDQKGSYKSDTNSDNVFTFSSLNLKEMEEKIPVEEVSNGKEAWKLFNFTYDWLMRANQYYDLNNNLSEYIYCSLQLAELYEHLAFFEKDIDNMFNLQNRCVYVLETINSLLLRDNMISVSSNVIREMFQVQLELMALNLQKLYRAESYSNKINVKPDADFIINFQDSESNITLTEQTTNMSKNEISLRKLKAMTSINTKLFWLRGYFVTSTPSNLSFRDEDQESRNKSF